MKASLRVGLGVMAVAGCLFAVACSDDDSSGGGGAAGSGGSAGSATGGTSGSGGVAGGSGGTGGAAGGGSGGVAGSGGSAGMDAGVDADDGGAGKFAKIQDLTVTVDCSTDAGDAKVDGAFNVLYDNTTGSDPKGGPLTSSFTFAKSAATMQWSFKPSPGASGAIAAGATQTVKHITTTTNVSSTDDPCNYCGGTVTVDVSWALDADAGVVTDSFGPVAFVCN